MALKENLELHAKDVRDIVAHYKPVPNAPSGFLSAGEVRRTFYRDMLELLNEKVIEEQQEQQKS